MAPKPLVTTQQPQEYDELDRLIDRYLGKMPRWMARFVTWIRQPHLRLLRMVSGVLLVFFGFLGFLPILGFWMVPLGLMLLAQDVRFLRRPVVRTIEWCERKWQSRRDKKPSQDRP